jgi:hypothetical protein
MIDPCGCEVVAEKIPRHPLIPPRLVLHMCKTHKAEWAERHERAMEDYRRGREEGSTVPTRKNARLPRAGEDLPGSESGGEAADGTSTADGGESQ